MAVGDRHGHAGFIDAQPGSHRGERAVGAMIGAGQQTAHPALLAADGRRGGAPPRFFPVGTDHDRAFAHGLEADKDKTHAPESLEEPECHR